MNINININTYIYIKYFSEDIKEQLSALIDKVTKAGKLGRLKNQVV
jgi:hypothetical protein